jgi:Fic family protein
VPVKASDTEKAMEELIYAYMDARDDSEINQLLLIPCVILDFLCIHPFQDGNGRMSRLLSLLLMYKNGFDVSKYISFEEQINLSKGNYYEALRQSSIDWHENKNDYIPFMENFLFTLYLCYKELDKRFLTLKSGKVSKAKRIEEIVLSAFIPISKKEIQDLLPDISVSTIERVLSEMLKNGKISKIGATNSAKYIKK